MPILLWDASALAKRFLPEIGTATVNALFAVPPPPMAVTLLGYIETIAILRRKFNQGLLDLTDLNDLRTRLELEVFVSPEFELLSINDTDVLGGIALIDQHNLNSTDAAILAACLRYARSQPAGAPTCVLVASDQRLPLYGSGKRKARSGRRDGPAPPAEHPFPILPVAGDGIEFLPMPDA